MAPHYMLIKDVTPNTKKHWMVKVLVLEKSCERVSQSSSSTYQRFIFQDVEGFKVPAVIFGRDIALFSNTLELLHKYCISNATVEAIAEKYSSVHKYQWIISSRTPVSELINDEEADNIKPIFNLVPFHEYPQYLATGEDLDVLAVVVAADAPKDITVHGKPATIQVFTIVNQEEKPTKLTLWDWYVDHEGQQLQEAVDFPIILAMHLRAVKPPSHTEISLSTRYTSSFLINPDLPEVASLQSWVSENTQFLFETKANKITADSTIAPERIWKIIDVLPQVHDKMKFQVVGFASIIDLKQKFWYMSCNNNKCRMAIEAEYLTQIQCRNCQQNVIVQPRCSFHVQISDDSGVMTAKIFGEVAEKIFPFTAVMLMQKHEELESEKKLHQFDIRSFGDIENKGEYTFTIRTKLYKENFDFSVDAVAELLQE